MSDGTRGDPDDSTGSRPPDAGDEADGGAPESGASAAPEVDGTTATTPGPKTAGADDESGTAADADDGRDVGQVLNYLLIGGATLFAAIAAIQLYLTTGRVIGRWIASGYQDLFRAAFNLVVLLVAVGVIVRQRRVAD